MRPITPLQARPAGFTLIELMLTVAVLGILASMAMPAFREFIAGQRIRTATSDLYASLIFARSEAMKRNVQVNIVRTGGAGAAWEGGWTVQIAGGTILQQQDALNSVSIAGPATGTVGYRWSGRPVAGSFGAAFVASSVAVPDLAARCVSLELSGMPSINRDTDGNAANGCQ